MVVVKVRELTKVEVAARQLRRKVKGVDK